MNNYLINTRQKAERALRAAQLQKEGVSENELLPALVTGENGDGYDVVTLDAQGGIGRAYERVFPFPLEQTFSADDEVWLWVPADGETPMIMGAGGGNGGCYGSFFFGALVS